METQTAPQGAPQSVTKCTQADLQVVVFKLAGHEYVADAAQVQEIIHPEGLLQVGGAPDYVVGLVKRRERIVPVIDLRKKLGLSAGEATPETSVIIAKLPLGPVGFLVDAALQLMWVKTHDFEVPSPVILGTEQACIRGVAHLGDRLLVMLDLAQALLPGERERVASLAQGRDRAETLYAGQEQLSLAEAQREQTRSGLRHLLVFELSNEWYGLPVAEAVEIRQPLPLMPLPHVPPHILGLINLRGAVLPVADLRRKFGLRLSPEGPHTRFIVVKGPGCPVALWADSVHGLVRLPRADFQPAPPGVARIAPEYYSQVTRLDGRILIELNIHKLLADTAGGERAAGT